MPKISTRRQVQRALKLTQLLTLFNSDSKDNSDLEVNLKLIHELLKKRYLAPRVNTLHNPLYERQKLANLPDFSFKQLFRTTLSSFMTLIGMIEDNPIFHNNSQNPQRDPAIQLAVALCRFGSNGNGAAIHRLKNLFSVGYGTVDLYTKRVIRVIIQYQSEMLTWPSKEERIEMSQVMQQEGFPGCVGFVDGTTIPLSQKPAIDGNHYFDRKRRLQLYFIIF